MIRSPGAPASRLGSSPAPHGLRLVRHRLRPPRPRAAACALGVRARRASNGRKARSRVSSRTRGARGTACPRSRRGNWAGAALAALEFLEVRGRTVLCPSNTFMATPLAIQAAGGRVEFVDCNRARPLHVVRRLRARRRTSTSRTPCSSSTSAATSRSTSSRSPRTAAPKGSSLIEDCAHAHGASWNGRRAGTWGDAGIWSFAATKTISTGEGGMLVSPHDDADRVRAGRSGTTASPTTRSPGSTTG